jgi:hypothetical protein
MADFVGILNESCVFDLQAYGRVPVVSRTLAGDIATVEESKTGAWSYSMTDRAGVDYDGVKAHDYLYDQILNRIWFSPSSIDAGFITDNTPYDVWIWNAFRDHAVTVSGVTPTDHDGVSFPVTIPAVIPSMQERKWTLTVTENGPAVMDMVFSLIMDELNYPIHITCMRVILMTVEPDWNDGISFSVAFDTIISTGKTLLEQRRSLIPVPARELTATYITEGIDDQILLNKVCWCHDKMVGVPLYHEPVYVEYIQSGDAVLVAVSDIAGYFNLNRLCKYVIIINRVSGLYGLYELDSISGQNLTLTKPVPYDYSGTDTVVYPVFFALIASADFDSLIPSARQTRITYKEFEYGE